MEHKNLNTEETDNSDLGAVISSVCQCEKPDIWVKVYEGLMCLNCMKPPKAD